ncbi:MAG: LysR family transcriptional regulator [Coriobacteriia bacterium]|nr:LysR family transcriptional regulator [Coriobacteriia bacterium]
MELRQLRYFCKTCETGNVTAAASALYVTEQTISSAVRKLEEELGCRLLERGSRGVAPTPQGRLLADRGTLILREVDALPGQIRRMGAGVASVTLAATTDSLTDVDFSDFERACPDVRAGMVEGSRARCLSLVADGQADVAFVPGPPQMPGLDGQLVRRGETVAVLAGDSPLASLGELSFDDLRNVTLLTPPDREYTVELIRQRCVPYGFSPTFRTVPMRFYFQAAQGGEGVAFVPRGHPMIAVTPGLAVVPLVERDSLDVPLYLVTREGVPRDSTAASFASWLGQRLREPSRPVARASRGTNDGAAQNGCQPQ